jgi:hypothetical protein
MRQARQRKLAGLGPRGEECEHSRLRRDRDRSALKELRENILGMAAHSVPTGTVADVSKVIKASGKEK